MFLKNRLAPQPVVNDPPRPVAMSTPVKAPLDHRTRLKTEVHWRLVQDLRRRGLDDSSSEEELRGAICAALDESVGGTGRPLPRPERERLLEEIYHDVQGLGPLEPLLADDTVSEIMVNGASRVYVERSGRIEKVAVGFTDETHLRRVIDRIVSRVGRRIDDASPMCDARLADGSRVNAIIGPLALDGSVLTIRKFRKQPLRVVDLLELGTISGAIAQFLESAVAAKLNILVSGGTGSGKTTLLNVLSAFIPHEERLITIEDAAELQLQQEHVIRLETRPGNIEGAGRIDQAELLRNSLRMRPDRIILGEVRGGEALTMLQAMNTGHEGSLATIHANSTRDALARLETMVLMAGMDLPLRAIREQVSGALDLIIQTERSVDGTRRVTSVTEVVGMEGETIMLQEIFAFARSGIDSDGRVAGQFRAMGLRPKCSERLLRAGYSIPAERFARSM